MKQHALDLLPAAIRARGQAGLRRGRIIVAGVISVLGLVITTSHSRYMLNAARVALYETQMHANQVVETERTADELRRVLDESNAYIRQYERTAYPLDVGAVIATVVQYLPPSVTLDRIDVDAGQRQMSSGPRAKPREREKDSKPDAPARVLVCELAGFAASDREIAEFVSRLGSTPPFRNASLDFSRTRDVRGLPAREFRISFNIDLDARYEVVPLNSLAGAISP